jgi:hypothetical protein
MLPTENPWPAMIVLVCVAIVCFARWIARRESTQLIIGIVCIALGLGCILLDVFVETPGERVAQNIYDLTSAFQQQDKQKTLSFFSPRAKERMLIELALDKVHIGSDLRISDVSVTFKAANSLAISHFRANASVSVNMPPFAGDLGFHPSRWELEWEREAGEWKIIKVHRLHPITGKEMAFMAGD